METLIVKTKSKKTAEKIIKILNIMDAQASYLDDYEDYTLGQMMNEGMETKTLTEAEKELFLNSLGK